MTSRACRARRCRRCSRKRRARVSSRVVVTTGVISGLRYAHPGMTNTRKRGLRIALAQLSPAAGAVIDALNALQVIDIGNRADVFTTLEAVFVKRHEHALIFAQAFDLFFRAAEDWKQMLDSVPLPDQSKKKPPPASRRVQEALSQPTRRETPQAHEQELRLSVSDKEILQKKDFAQMSAAEIAQVTRAIAQMKLPQAELRTRRHQPDPRGLGGQTGLALPGDMCHRGG